MSRSRIASNRSALVEHARQHARHEWRELQVGAIDLVVDRD
jgi:hypothetical protein